jgi:hypothetical protein
MLSRLNPYCLSSTAVPLFDLRVKADISARLVVAEAARLLGLAEPSVINRDVHAAKCAVEARERRAASFRYV